METTTQQIEPSSSTAMNEKEFIPAKNVTSKPLKDWAYEEAGLNQGDPMAFENRLRWIEAGHIVDGSYDIEEELLRKKQLEAQIATTESEKSNKEKDQQHLKDVIIADKENQLKQQKSNIENKQIQLAEGKVRSLYIPARFWLYTSLAIIISFYLIFFYASAVNASFFRSMQQLVNGNSNDDVTLMLNSIFDAKGIFKASPNLIFVYLGAFLFFGFGTLPHIFHDGSKYQWAKVVAAVIVCFLIDCLIAYKIDSGIHQLKLMMGVADADWGWYKSVNFYLVMAFGFGTYMLWGFLYEAALKEHSKKDVNAKVQIEIKGIKKRIREIENEIIGHKTEMLELQKAIDALKITIESLKKAIERALMKPETLLRNMENFYSGWLQFLNGSNSNLEKKNNCESLYKIFHQKLSTVASTNN